MKYTLILLVTLFSTIALANSEQFIRCDITDSSGGHLAGETSSLARGTDLTDENGFDFFAYIDGRTDKRVFRIEAYDSLTGDLITSKTTSYYKAETAALAVEVNGLAFACEMHR